MNCESQYEPVDRVGAGEGMPGGVPVWFGVWTTDALSRWHLYHHLPAWPEISWSNLVSPFPCLFAQTAEDNKVASAHQSALNVPSFSTNGL